MTISAFKNRVAGMSRELKLFFAASFTLGTAYSLFDSIFNNYLNARFSLNGFERSFLEFPREFPGVMVVFVAAALSFLCSRRIGVVSMLLTLAGTLLIGFLSPGYTLLVIWLFIYSTGQHLFMPMASTIGMELAREGRTAQRLGQFNAVRNAASICGSVLVAMGFRYLGMNFQHTFFLAAVGFAISAALLFVMKKGKARPAPGLYLKMHKEYKWYYLLTIISGARKQIFITFAPWVLVTIFNQPTQTMATLMMAGGVIGIIFQPLLGWAVDRFRERTILAAEAVLLVFVCLLYGFSRSLFPENIAFYITCACYLADQMLMSVGMARSTYMKKIAKAPEDVQAALSLGVSIDHIFSISLALVGGVIWNRFGFQYVFLMGVIIAVINFFVALQARVPEGNPQPETNR